MTTQIGWPTEMTIIDAERAAEEAYWQFEAMRHKAADWAVARGLEEIVECDEWADDGDFWEEIP